jgi:acetyl-CoA carboxylase carboxyltransferase component
MDNGEDIGGQFADHDHWLELQALHSGIKEDRKRRVRELAGKFVVATQGRSSGNIVFYQDQKVNSGGYWTQYLSNALGFSTLGEAKMHASGFKYGNPRVAVVTSEGLYQWI